MIILDRKPFDRKWFLVTDKRSGWATKSSLIGIFYYGWANYDLATRIFEIHTTYKTKFYKV